MGIEISGGFWGREYIIGWSVGNPSLMMTPFVYISSSTSCCNSCQCRQQLPGSISVTTNAPNASGWYWSHQKMSCVALRKSVWKPCYISFDLPGVLLWIKHFSILHRVVLFFWFEANEFIWLVADLTGYYLHVKSLSGYLSRHDRFNWYIFQQ